MTYDELKNLVAKHCHLYYDLSAPEISDAEFDKLYDQLVAVEKAQNWTAFDSPTRKVGGQAGKVRHPIKLYSLNKVYDPEEVDSKFDVKSPKIDGANLTLIYRFGKLVLALTRGDGEFGEDVTYLAKHITNIPLEFPSTDDRFVVNGECATDNDVENYRNYVSGALGLKDENEFKSRNIKFIVHDLLDMNCNYTDRMDIAHRHGFTTVLDKEAEEYPTDGVVYRINDYAKCQKLGYTSKYPKFAIALKERGVNTAITTLQDVIWVIGRTGTVNPTGIVDPVILDDATISRVTLHNIGIIEEHGIGLGDKIEIERAGGVIPKFLRVVEHSKNGIKVTKKFAEQAIDADTYREGPKLKLVDKAKAGDAKLVEYFIKTMGIKGLGPATVKKMNILHPVDIYEIKDWSTVGANGAKIKQEIEISKTKPYETVLAALGIPGVGKSTAKIIVSKINSFSRLHEIEIVDIKGIGPNTTESILTWLEENKYWVENLPLQLSQEVNVNIDNISTSTARKKVCITGKMDMTRNDLSDKLEDLGYTVVSTVTKNCDVLISGGDTTSSKYKKAIQYGIPVVDYWSNKKNVLLGNF